MTKFREPLAFGTELALSGTVYKITGMLGSGTNAICYRATYDDSSLAGKRHACLIKELFPLHDRGLIRRSKDGNILVYPEAESVFELHKRSFLRGCAVGIDLNDERPDKSMPMLNTHETNGTVYAVIGISGGVPLEGKSVKTLRAAAEISMSILHALHPFHSAGLWHLDISPDNILLMPRDKGENADRILLIDYNSVFSTREIADERGVYFSIKKPFSAPEVILGDVSQIGAATDMYSVVAVFARLLFPDFNGDVSKINRSIPIFQGAPQTAVHKAISIIRRGLRLSAGNRYPSIDALLPELQELLNRIDRVGITLPALWEASAIQYELMIASNPKFSHVSTNIIPSQLSAGDISENTLLTGDGGIGKTTVLLRIWQSGVQNYSQNAPVPVYIRLTDYSKAQSIRLRCLDRLRFTEATSTVADALKALDDIFDQPNSVVLLLDGLNEVQDNERESLLKEISDLSKLGGVRMVISSRTDGHEFAGYTRAKIQPLSLEFVKNYLGANHLLYPDNQALRELLTNPMMLTLYAAVVGNSSEHVDSFDEVALIKAYLDYTVSKAHAIKVAEFAVGVILPRIAAVMAKQKAHAISGPQLLECIEWLYVEIKGKHFYREFPEYIGESAALLSGAQSADEWFGAIVSRLIGRELSLLIRTESGQFTFTHQLFRDYFADTASGVERRLLKVAHRRRSPKMILSVSIAVCLILSVVGISFYVSTRVQRAFPATDGEIKVVDEAMAVLKLANSYSSTSISEGNSMIEKLQDPPPEYGGATAIEGWMALIQTEFERVKKSSQFTVLDSSRIDKTVERLNIPGNTIPRDAYRALCQFPGEFTEQRDALLNGIYDKWLVLEDGSPRLTELYARYEAWSSNKAFEYALLLQYAIHALPGEYQALALDVKYLSAPFPQLLRDHPFDVEKYESDLERTRAIDAQFRRYFRLEGIII